ncbi:MAG: acetyl-CoA carboxylase biotin carboxylase subunit [Eubacteriales bacterium]
MFSKILIANRNEIAVRIIRACKEMGISTVAVYSEADRESLHVSLADESYCIGPARVSDSYLNMNTILTVAQCSGAEAIHPGYGLLSENTEFAELCEACNIKFIGPRSDVVRRMGSKDEARITMKNNNIPVIPGCDYINSVDIALNEAEKIGYPVMIKARAGGGGRGIRIAHDRNEIEKVYNTASVEAKNAFGDGTVYLEKYLSPVKHVEIQIIGDNYNNIVCIGDRDCSIQRKNQKLLEECPAPTLPDITRKNMMETAVKAAEAVGYTGVGTIEFLLDSDNNFYFLEMNTRLQVEHCVTEMATGIDIVKWQIRVAAGYELGFSQADISYVGQAIECRINAENPLDDFRPSCGEITLLHVPGGHNVRFDTAVYQNYYVPPFYDSLIGKLIVCAKTREEAMRKMRCALSELVIEGINHNSELQLDILSDDDFINGTYTTGFLAEKGYV